MGTKHNKGRHPARRSGRSQRPRNGRRRAARWTFEPLSSAPVGPDVITPSLEEVLTAVERLPTDLDWEVIAGHVVPMFPRVRPHPSHAPDPLQVIVPPGVAVGFGIDLGAGFVAITRPIMESWQLTGAELLGVALGNLKERMARVSPRDVVQQAVDDVPVMVLQSGTGCGSALVLLPEELERLFGRSPKLLLAPMRDILIALPMDADRLLAAELFDLFASQDPNCLAPRAYFQRRGQVTIDEPAPDLPSEAPAASAFH